MMQTTLLHVMACLKRTLVQLTLMSTRLRLAQLVGHLCRVHSCRCNYATKALATIDNAIDTVNSIRGDLGALQNRLEYTINNLSSISNHYWRSWPYPDADFAKETSELTKHQILTQAATMLAQANQSKQGIWPCYR